jgi:hypothetical protein
MLKSPCHHVWAVLCLCSASLQLGAQLLWRAPCPLTLDGVNCNDVDSLPSSITGKVMMNRNMRGIIICRCNAG